MTVYTYRCNMPVTRHYLSLYQCAQIWTWMWYNLENQTDQAVTTWITRLQDASVELLLAYHNIIGRLHHQITLTAPRI